MIFFLSDPSCLSIGTGCFLADQVCRGSQFMCVFFFYSNWSIKNLESNVFSIPFVIYPLKLPSNLPGFNSALNNNFNDSSFWNLTCFDFMFNLCIHCWTLQLLQAKSYKINKNQESTIVSLLCTTELIPNVWYGYKQ